MGSAHRGCPTGRGVAPATGARLSLEESRGKEHQKTEFSGLSFKGHSLSLVLLLTMRFTIERFMICSNADSLGNRFV